LFQKVGNVIAPCFPNLLPDPSPQTIDHAARQPGLVVMMADLDDIEQTSDSNHEKTMTEKVSPALTVSAEMTANGNSGKQEKPPSPDDYIDPAIAGP
jgi:hypothetical protein